MKATCCKTYGVVEFGSDGLCPISGERVDEVPCSKCKVVELTKRIDDEKKQLNESN